MNEARLEATDHVEIGGEALLATGGMTRPGVSESIVWQIVHGPDIAPDKSRRGAGGLQRGCVGAAPARRARPDDRSDALVKKMAAPARAGRVFEKNRRVLEAHDRARWCDGV